jgi:hypothetical protein
MTVKETAIFLTVAILLTLAGWSLVWLGYTIANTIFG